MLIALLIVAGLAVMNTLAGRSVRAGSDARFKQNMLIAMIWCVPFMGLFMAYGHTTRAPEEPAAHLPLPGIVEGPAARQLRVQGLPQLDLDKEIRNVNGFPMIDRDTLERWTLGAADRSGPAGMLAATRAWLLHLRDVCGPSFRLYETAGALILSPLDNRVLCAPAAYIATTRKRISQVRSGVASFPNEGKSVLLVLHNEDVYYQYLAGFYPDEGELAMSSGVFIDAGISTRSFS